MPTSQMPITIQLLLILLVSILVIAIALFLIYFILIHQSNGHVMVDGEKRTYILFVPKSYDPAKPAPLVISIHGFADWPANQQSASRWNDLAERYGFIVVYPSGTGFPLHWRASNPSASVKDVTFISALIDKLEGKYNIDPRRIYANGFSNGGGMSFVLACTLTDRIAAIAGVSGAYLYPWQNCSPSRPVPLIAFHGTADPVVPYSGGRSDSFNYPFPAIPDWVKTYADRNGCSADPVEIPSTGELTGIRYTNCSQNAEVIFYTITNSGHSWPGSKPLPKWVVGKTNQDVNATELIWQFFEQHPLKQ